MVEQHTDRADLIEALAHLNYEAKRIPAHWRDDKARIHGHINAMLDDLDLIAAEDAEAR